MAKKQIDVVALMTRMAAQDPWRLRVIGRETGLGFMRKKMRAETRPEYRTVWQDIVDLEKSVIQAAKNQDQEAWDRLNAIKTPYEAMKALKNKSVA
jgi:hypothetical protein